MDGGTADSGGGDGIERLQLAGLGGICVGEVECETIPIERGKLLGGLDYCLLKKTKTTLMGLTCPVLILKENAC